MRTALRTAVATALVAGVAITTPALAAGAAFAADGPAAVKPAAPAAPSAPTAAAPAEQAADPAETPAKTPAESRTKTPAKTPAAAPSKTPAGTATVQDEATASTAPVRTVQLAGGLSAKVYAKGDQHPYYTATVIKGGVTLGELKAGAGYGGKDTKVFAGYAVTLDSEGKVTAVAVDAANGTLLRTVQLAGGLSAKVYAKGDQHPYYTATVIKGG
ncbi:hypothetical protein ACFU5Y_35840, partial [Streptomyces gardneri]